MPALDIPFFGTLVLSLTLISASYTMAVAIGAGSGTITREVVWGGAKLAVLGIALGLLLARGQ